jgi:UDP-N-acetylglucosamine 2-epimerase (non-hydrolysing)
MGHMPSAMNHIYVVLGTKAQMIKMAPIMVELQRRNIDYSFIHTGQHKETMDDLIANFGTKQPDMYLYHGPDIARLSQVVPWMLRILYSTVSNRKQLFARRGVILVHGDTFSTVLGALIGRLSGLKVGHIESGLRSFSIFHPFPEELTRLMTFRLSDVFFCPNEWAVRNLRSYRGRKINCGANTIYDALQLAVNSTVDVPVPCDKYAVCSIHRFENIFQKAQFQRIVEIIEEVSRTLRLLFILHPPTKRKLEEFGFWHRLVDNRNIEMRPRYDFFTFNRLLMSSEFILTDGGSNQEECFYLGKPCLLLRYKTERLEGLGKCVVLSKLDPAVVRNFVRDYPKYSCRPSCFSKGPSSIIVDALQDI